MPEEQRFVLGIAYQAGPDPRIQRGVDGGRDYFTKEELEKACWSYMRSGAPQMNAFHLDGTEDCAEPVESFIWRWPDWDAGDGVVVKDGDWCLGAILSPRMWALHKAGKVNGLSPEGTARRRRVAKEGAVSIAKSSGIADDDEEMTELVDASFRKVALVGSGANGIPRFLIAKEGASAGLVDAATVRELIAKAPQEDLVPEPSDAEETALPNGIVLKGSPAAMAAFIHAASVRSDVTKAEKSTKSINDLPSLSDQERVFLAKAILAGCEYVFDGYVAPIEKTMMVRAEHEDVLKSVCSAMFPGHDVTDIVRRLGPAANGALVKKASADHRSERVAARVGVNVPASGHGGPLSDVLAVQTAILRSEANALRGKVGELLLTGEAGRGGAGDARMGRIPLLKSELARVAAEDRALKSTAAVPMNFPAAFEALLSVGHGSILKADMSSADINDLKDSDFAYIEPGGKKDDEGKTVPRSLRHFPIMDAAHVRNALSRAPQSPFGDKAMPKIRAAAKKFGIDVAKEAGVSNVAKDMGTELDGDPDAMDALDVTMPLAEPVEMGPGDPTVPGSPAWESVDAASAAKWLGVLARAKNALCMLAERELLEAASADPDDAENAWDLEDAKCAIEFAIETLAVFAAGEQMEAELGAEMADIGKAAAGSEAPLAVIEGFTAVRKAGRVLSSANEAAIRGAVDSLQKVLASLPEAPVAKSKEAAMTAAQTPAADVAKETASPDEQARNTGPVNAGGTTGMGEPRMTGPEGSLPADGPQKAMPGDVPGRAVVKSALALVYDRERNLVGVTDQASVVQRVAKADDGEKKAMQAVFDQDGDLIGIVDPDAIQPVTGAGGKPADDGDGEMQDSPAAAAAPDDDMTPQPPADAGTPAEDVAKAGTQNVITLTSDVAKSIAEQAAKTALEASEAAHAQVVAKMAADNAGLAEQVEAMKSRLETVENMPAAPKVFANGQVPPAHQLRGQDQGGERPVDVAKARALKETLYRGTAAEQNAAFGEMQQMAVDQLAAIQRR